jgi:CheY-like chemotaxis protein
MSRSQVLIIENDHFKKNHCLNEFKRHKLSNTVFFSHDTREALAYLKFEEKEKDFEGSPQIILLNFSKEGMDFVRKVRSEIRYRAIKIYYLLEKDSNQNIDRNFLFENKISGIIRKPITFKAIDNLSYLDSFSLYLDLLKMQSFKV